MLPYVLTIHLFLFYSESFSLSKVDALERVGHTSTWKYLTRKRTSLCLYTIVYTEVLDPQC